MVCRKLHNERSRVAGEHLGLLQHDTRNDDSCHTDKVCRSSNPSRAAEDSAGDHRDKRNFRAARDKGGGHNGHLAVAVIFNGTRSHDTRNAASRTDKHRDKGLTGKTEFTEDTVKDERDTRHITACFKECKE